MKYSHLTFQDLYIRGVQQILSLNKLLERKEMSIEDIGGILPCGLTINWHGGNLYNNSFSENVFKKSKEETFQMGHGFISEIFEEENYKSIMSLFQSNLNEMLYGKPIGYLNRLKIDNQPTYFTFAKIFDSDIFINDSYFSYLKSLYKAPIEYQYSQYDRFIQSALRNNKLVLVMGFDPRIFNAGIRRVDKIIDQEYLLYKKTNHFLKLTIREKQIIKLWVNGKTSKEMASQLNLSEKTVETHRKNIYGKLEIHSFSTLMKFAQSFDLL